jgi:hypothetical protein
VNISFASAKASDNSGQQVVSTCNVKSGSKFHYGLTTVTCSAQDSSKNKGQCTFKVSVNDLAAPNIQSCPPAITQVDTQEVAFDEAFPAFDNFDRKQVTTQCNVKSGAVLPFGVTTVTCSAKDSLSNVAYCTFPINILDKTAPSVTCPPDITQVNNQIVQWQNATAVDNSGAKVVSTCNVNSGSKFEYGESTVTCSSRDTSGNIGQCTFKVIVNDKIAPVVLCPPDITQVDNQVVMFDSKPPATDNSGKAVTSTCNAKSNSTFAFGTTTVTCTSTDASKNVGRCAFHITILDRTAPKLQCPKDIIQHNVRTVSFSPATAIDNSGLKVASQCNFKSGDIAGWGKTSVTCTATDVSKNTGSCTFRITILDTTPPDVTCPPDIIQVNDQIATWVTPAVADNSGKTLTTSCSAASGSIFPFGSSVVTCAATDASNNTGACSFTVTINDKKNPTVVCPPDITQRDNQLVTL